MDKFIKSFVLAAAGGAAPDGNTIAGVANVMGVPDRGRDVVFPYAFRSAVGTFLEQGFVPVGHSWGGLPVAMPTKAEDRGRELYVEAEFHSTDDAQKAKTIVRERLAKGLKVGFSVGFYSHRANWNWFDSGSELLTWAGENGHDMALFDQDAIKALGSCRGIVRVDELFEFSIVSVPMNRDSGVRQIKSILEGGMPLSDHLETALGAVESVVNRMEELVALRAEKGESVSRERLEDARLIRDRLSKVLSAAEQPTNDPSAKAEIEALQERALRLRASLATA